MNPLDLLVIVLVGFSLGTVLGLLGGGGGILAIPLLIHVLGQSVDQATTTSLIVVAIGAAAGLIPHALAGRVDWRAGLTFGVLGTAGSIIGARGALVADDRLQLAGLIALILLAASAMLRNTDESKTTKMRHRIPVDSTGEPIASSREPEPEPAAPSHRWLRLLASATGVGLVTGFFGVGGGFIAVPALIWGVGLPVKKATATGLVVIIINSMVALAARGTSLIEMPLTAELAAAAIVGAVFGALLSHRFSAAGLKRLFGWLLLVVAAHEIYQLALLY